MRGIYFPNANLIFDVQKVDPGAPKKKSADSGSATDTYGNAYTGWEVVENAAIALTDGVDLILAPGRSCQNGKPVPYRQADYLKFAAEMRKAGLAVLQAAHTKIRKRSQTRPTTSPMRVRTATRCIATRVPLTVRRDAVRREKVSESMPSIRPRCRRSTPRRRC